MIIKPLAEGKLLEFSFKDTIKLNNSYNLHDYDTQAEINGTLSKNGKIYVCEAEVVLEVIFNCDKCLKPTTKTLNFTLNEKFSNAEFITNNEDEEEINLFHDSQIDLTDYIKAGIFANMPMQVFCSESCKGLCPICGTDLNVDSCKCDNVVLNPKFEVLRSLFTDEEV